MQWYDSDSLFWSNIRPPSNVLSDDNFISRWSSTSSGYAPLSNIIYLPIHSFVYHWYTNEWISNTRMTELVIQYHQFIHSCMPNSFTRVWPIHAFSFIPIHSPDTENSLSTYQIVETVWNDSKRIWKAEEFTLGCVRMVIVGAASRVVCAWFYTFGMVLCAIDDLERSGRYTTNTHSMWICD